MKLTSYETKMVQHAQAWFGRALSRTEVKAICGFFALSEGRVRDQGKVLRLALVGGSRTHQERGALVRAVRIAVRCWLDHLAGMDLESAVFQGYEDASR